MIGTTQDNVIGKDNIAKQDLIEVVKGFGTDMTTPHTGALWTSFSRNYYKLQSQMSISKRSGNNLTLSMALKKSILSPPIKVDKLCGVSD